MMSINAGCPACILACPLQTTSIVEHHCYHIETVYRTFEIGSGNIYVATTINVHCCCNVISMTSSIILITPYLSACTVQFLYKKIIVAIAIQSCSANNTVNCSGNCLRRGFVERVLRPGSIAPVFKYFQ